MLVELWDGIPGRRGGDVLFMRGGALAWHDGYSRFSMFMDPFFRFFITGGC